VPTTVDRVRDRLSATLDRLAADSFSPTSGPWCRGCDFLAACPAGQAEVQPA
jgi:hypothetical protein